MSIDKMIRPKETELAGRIESATKGTPHSTFASTTGSQTSSPYAKRTVGSA